ncbi:hypothetical protein DV735_g681, partial [Chaetothyriales sp. CBS 134920]
MSDSGLDHPVPRADSPADKPIGKKLFPSANRTEAEALEDEDNFLQPTRWWYASTVIPLAAGTFGPMACTFSICALVENWREYVPAGSSADNAIRINDPAWVLILNSLSLVISLAANLSLFLNMARRLPFNIAQPITILGFWIASVLLIVIIVCASVNPWRRDIKHQSLTQAYYYAIFAAALYQILSYLLCITVYGAVSGHYSKDFNLTAAQRTLMLQTILYFLWQNLWALAYSHIENWSFLDAVYWADFTSLSIGLGGKYVPITHLGRSLLFPFALGGILLLGLVVGSIHSLVLERSHRKLAARVTEKTREKLVKRIEYAFTHGQLPNLIRQLQGRNRAPPINLGQKPLPETARRRLEFEAMRNVQRTASKKRRYLSLVISTFAFAFLWAIGAYIFYKTETEQGWSYFASLYFAYATLLTIGYGDLVPESNSGKPFFVFWSLLAVPTLTILISNMGDTAVKAFKELVIWLGEITILPSTEHATSDRFKYGMYKIGLKTAMPQKNDDSESGADSDSSSQDFQELHPGLAKAFRLRRRKNKEAKRDDMGARMATDFEQAEEMEEASAKSAGDQESQDHHYRHELLQQIKRVYGDVLYDDKKHYSYDDWAYFMYLLGHDESDASHHIHIPDKASSKDDLNKLRTDAATGASKWSWLSPTSPLMMNKDEPEWVLSRLVSRLEQNLREAQLELEKHKDLLREARKAVIAAAAAAAAATPNKPSDTSATVDLSSQP